MPKTHKTIMHI